MFTRDSCYLKGVKKLNENNWILDNLQYALEHWNQRLQEVWDIITMSPAEFKNGAVWNVMVSINNALQSIGLALLVLFFLVGVVKTCGSFTELKRPETAFKLLIRFIIAKGVITYGMELMMSLFAIVQGVLHTMIGQAGIVMGDGAVLPEEIKAAVGEVGFFQSIPLWAVSLIGCLVIIVMGFILILTVYSRFFKLYLYTAIAPIPLSSFAGEPSSSIGKSFIKSYAAVCLEGAVIVIACIIFTVLASTPTIKPDSTAITMLWGYIVSLVFNMLILVGVIRMSDRIIREMMGLYGG